MICEDFQSADCRFGSAGGRRAGGGKKHYRVTGFEVVEASASGIEAHAPGPDRLALVTCWPFGALQRGTLRYVVHAEAEPRRTAAMR